MILAIGAVMFALPAQADITLTYELPIPHNGPNRPKITAKVTIYIDGAGNYRRELRIDRWTTIQAIRRDGILYVMRTPRSGGPMVVIRQSDAAILDEESSAQFWKGKPPARAPIRTEIVDVGPEEVAGYRGEHYRIKTWFGNSQAPDRDVVLSTDRRLSSVIGVQVVAQPPALVDKAGNEKYYELFENSVLLRDDGRMQLENVNTAPIAPKMFELPGPVLVLEEARKLFPPSALMPPAPPAPVRATP
jgi:hypothetical protein